VTKKKEERKSEREREEKRERREDQTYPLEEVEANEEETSGEDRRAAGMDGVSTVKLHGGSSGDAGDERGERKGDDTPGATGDFGDKDPTGWIPASKLQKGKKAEYTYIIKRKRRQKR
jgi:hypothetical protein